MTTEEAIKTLKENLCAQCAYGCSEMDNCDIRYCDNRDAIKTLEQDTVSFDFELYEAGMMSMPKEMIKVLEKIRAEIERLHYHPKLDFIKNDKVVEMAIEIIDKYKVERESKK